MIRWQGSILFRRPNPVCIACLIGLSFLSSEAAYGQTLDTAIRTLLERNLSLQAAQMGVEVQEQTVSLVASELKPQLSLVGSGIVSETGLLVDTPFQVSRTALGAQLIVSQKLYDGGRTKARINEARNSADAARARLDLSRESALLQGITAYMNVIARRSVMDIRQRNIDILITQTEAAELRFELGIVTRTDLAQTQSSLLRARAALLQARTDLAVSENLYEQIFFVPPSDLSRPEDFPATPENLSEALAIAFDRNPKLGDARSTIDALDNAVSASKAARKPNVNLTLSYRSDSFANDLSFGSSRDDLFLAGTLTLPLYTGGGLSSRERIATARSSQARFLYQETIRDVRQDVTSSWIALQNANAEIDLRREQLKMSLVAYEGAVEEQKQGRRSTFEVLNLEQELFQARIAVLTTEIALINRSAALLEGIGILGEAFKVSQTHSDVSSLP